MMEAIVVQGVTKTFGPLLEVARIQSEINRLFDNLLDLGADEATGSGAWIPNVDVIETETDLVVKAELPGVDASQLSLSVLDGNVIIDGEITIVWQDTRTAELCDRLGGEAGPDRFRSRTGLPLATYFSGPKAVWLLDHIEGARERAEAGDPASALGVAPVQPEARKEGQPPQILTLSRYNRRRFFLSSVFGPHSQFQSLKRTLRSSTW